MIKSVLAAVLIIAATLGGLYAPTVLQKSGGGESGEAHAKPEPFKSDHIAVAIFEDGKVIGYFTSRLTCELTDPSFKASILPRLTHELYKTIHSSAGINFRKASAEQLSSIAEKITKGVNDRASKPIIEKLVIEEPDFLRRL
jgi:hypothetical protein